MKILVTGGAGYIGSHMVRELLERGHSVVVADSLERGYEKALDPRAVFAKGDLLDKSFVKALFDEQAFEAVMHFAGFIAVGESMEKPGLYFQNNVQSTINVLDQMAEKHVNKFIFSSTGTVYGTPQTDVLTEKHPTNPENPYALTKRMVEQILHWYFVIHDIRFAALRYFNASGASLDGKLGEAHNPETHLIPNAIQAALSGKEFTLFGGDYDTPDGTCIRDYIHVLDLVAAHLLTLDELEKHPGEYIYNVGTGRGFSNREVIKMVEKISGKMLDIKIAKRRPGDVAKTVADPTKIAKALGFTPQYSDLETIIKTAWNWHKNSGNA